MPSPASRPVSFGIWKSPDAKFRLMNAPEDVLKYAADQGIAEEEALKKGMEEKSKEFAEKGAEVYAKA